MKLTDGQKEKIVKEYIKWADQLFDDLDWVEVIPPEVFVRKIIDMVEEESE